jgi:hypothetical protein
MFTKFQSAKSRVIAGVSILAVAGACFAPLPAMAGTQDAAISNTQVNAASAQVDARGRGALTVVQLGTNAASNSISQRGRGDKAAAIDNTQVNSADAALSKAGRGRVTVFQAGANFVSNRISQRH